jgi:hypothetical protein
LSTREKGLVVVFEGRRTCLRVFRRLFSPVKVSSDYGDIIVYSDTRDEREIRYSHPEEYGLDDPFKVISLIRLARALNCLERGSPQEGDQTCRVTICRSSELIGPNVERDDWVPFDPARLKSLDERIKEARRRAEWASRMKKV